MDTGVRLQRYIMQEWGEIYNLSFLKNGAVATLLAVGTCMGLAFGAGGLDGSGGLLIWPLFGTTNQLMASLTLSIIAVMLIRKRRNPLPAVIPLVIVFVLSFWAAIEQLVSFADPAKADWLLFALDVIIVVSSIWVAVEAVIAMRKAATEPPEGEDEDARLQAVREEV
jgi:carbon starvation protein